MAKLSPDAAMVNARIVYWGIEGAGKTANLHAVHDKLRPDHRGDLERVPTRLDPTVEYELLPIELGEIAGLRTRIQIVAVPGAAGQAATRKQLLDQADGIVLVVDSRRERIDENAASLAELRASLNDYGRSLEEIPLVIQYNKRDLTDPFALDELHRRLQVEGAAVFEAVATETTGVLQTLSTVSKRVIRTLREQQFDVGPAATESDLVDEAPPVPTPVDQQPEPLSSTRMEDAILDEADHPESAAIEAIAHQTETMLDSPWDEVAEDFAAGARLGSELTITSVGEASRSGERGVRVPIVVADKEGRTSTLVLTISLDPLPEADVD